MKKGTLVRLTADNLPLVASPRSTRFETRRATRGEEGVYWGRHWNLHLRGWHLVRVRSTYAPVHRSQFEEV